ncbi:OmpA family protein [Candidatus Manganitrophus noduliformans]|nr:OmpA family protein [Candidatus Manganitrophus noduliformans]
MPYQYSSDMGVAIEAVETFVLCDCKSAPALAVKPKEIPIALRMTEPFHLPSPVKEEPIQDKEEVSEDGGVALSEDTVEPAIIQFGLNENRITPTQEEEILQAVERIKTSEGKVRVVGHTCDLGKKEQNDRLSLTRAERVAAILKERGIVVAEVVGKGSCCPRSADRRFNRRVEILVMKNGGDHEK